MKGLKSLLRPPYIFCKFCVGFVVWNSPLSRYGEFLLSTWNDREKRSAWDDLLYPCVYNYWLERIYLKESDPDRAEELKQLAMGGNSGKNWAAMYEKKALDFNLKVGGLTLREAVPLYEEMHEILRGAGGLPLTVIQIGSSSGREIAHYAERYPHFDFIGTDIYDSVLDWATSHHQFPNLKFCLCPAKDIKNLLREHLNRGVVVFSSGSLQYVRPEHLDQFFSDLAGHPNIHMILHEPGRDSEGSPDQLHTSRWRGNFSYTQDYRYYAEKYGLVTVKCEIIRPYLPLDQFPGYEDTVHYFYHGRSPGGKISP